MYVCLSVCLSVAFQTVTTHSLKKHTLTYFTSNKRAHQLQLIDAYIFLNLKKVMAPIQNIEKVLLLRVFHLYNIVVCVKRLP